MALKIKEGVEIFVFGAMHKGFTSDTDLSYLSEDQIKSLKDSNPDAFEDSKDLSKAKAKADADALKK
jgi:hypothetical protein